MSADSPASPAVSRAAVLFSITGDVVRIVVRQLVPRSLLWFPLGLLAGLLAMALSLVLSDLPLQENSFGVMLRAALLMSLPPLGLALFGIHGLNRGAAHVALALEARWGLVAQAADGILGPVRQRLGTQLANLPLAQLEAALKAASGHYLDYGVDGRGPTAWVLRNAQRLVVEKVETVLLSAYRAALTAQGGGGIDLDKVRDQAVAQLTTHLRDFLLGPLNKQLVLLLVLFFGLGVGGYPLVAGLYRLGQGIVAMF